MSLYVCSRVLCQGVISVEKWLTKARRGSEGLVDANSGGSAAIVRTKRRAHDLRRAIIRSTRQWPSLNPEQEIDPITADPA